MLCGLLYCLLVSVCLLLLTYGFDLRLLLAACALCSVAVCGLLVCWSVGLVVLFAGCFAVLICFYWLVVWLAVLWLFLAITFVIGFAAGCWFGLWICGLTRPGWFASWVWRFVVACFCSIGG